MTAHSDRIRPNHEGTGIFIKSGPLLGTLTRDDAFKLANAIADTLEQP